MSARSPTGLNQLRIDESDLDVAEGAQSTPTSPEVASTSSTPPSYDHLARVSPAESRDYSSQPSKRTSVTLAPTAPRFFGEHSSIQSNRNSAPEARNLAALVTDFGSWPRQPQAGDTVVRPPLPPHPHQDDLPGGQDKVLLHHKSTGIGDPRPPAILSLAGMEDVGVGVLPPLPATPPTPLPEESTLRDTVTRAAQGDSGGSGGARQLRQAPEVHADPERLVCSEVAGEAHASTGSKPVAVRLV
mmetsp:Transcript_25598/g.65079  ORF Transcript_25598/g.65079 Transcript_25598/m.65079 type:complete len:244 (-) Transcript_25598:220-951(-)|eukprot:CAMPEP_0174944894 /NCGR_PEP_ID=MMETSP1355-20121228/80198_1 /TAXON_ID=464990 /ORGANISM="Hemiselmis tepida, Strain CCMP443" /LENGTH=243 /DNA_ID=CAMNT_0016192223 /DNA_START=133 /DNA_END=864 /DNA_ORIENTATION=-